MMPTNQIVQKYDILHHSLLHMLELKKNVDKLEAEHRTKKGQTARVSFNDFRYFYIKLL